MTKRSNGNSRNHVCRTPTETPPSQECDRIEAEIDLARDQLFGAKSIVDMYLRDAASKENGDTINALALLCPILAKAAEHISQIELAVWNLSKSRGMQGTQPAK